MYGIDILLKHQIVEGQRRELLAEVERRHAIDAALNATRTRSTRRNEARAAIASLLLRAGTWLTPDEGGNSLSHPGRRAFAARTGQGTL